MKKRILSFLLALLMIVSYFPVIKAEAASSLPTGWVACDGAVATTLEGAYEEVVQLFKIFTAMNRGVNANDVSNITPYFTTTGYSCTKGHHESCEKCEWRAIARKMAEYGLITQELANRIGNSGYAYTCQGFANFVRFYLYHGITTTAGMQSIVGATYVSGSNDATLKALFSKAKIGDYVYFTGHPVMFHSITSNGIKILDNNSRISLASDEASTIRIYELTWSNIRNMNDKNNSVSITRPPESWLSHYSSSDSTSPTAPSASMTPSEYLNLANVKWGAYSAVAYPKNGGSINTWKLPWTNNSDPKLKLGTVSNDIHIINVIENHAGNIWYEYKTGTGTRGFVYSGDLLFRPKETPIASMSADEYLNLAGIKCTAYSAVAYPKNGGSVQTWKLPWTNADKNGKQDATLKLETISGDIRIINKIENHLGHIWYEYDTGTSTRGFVHSGELQLRPNEVQKPYYESVDVGSITENNAVIKATCLNPGKVTLETGGFYISTKPGAVDNGTKYTDNIPSSYQTATSLPCSYNLANEYGISLSEGTTYYYVLYVTDNAENPYYSQEYFFTTKGHSHSHTATVTNPTCTDQGYTTYTCTCGDSYTDSYVNAKGHSFSYQVTEAPTTSATGTLAGICSECSNTTTETLPKLSTTDYTYQVTKEPSNTETGTGRYTWNTTTYGTFYFEVTLDKLAESNVAQIVVENVTATAGETVTMDVVLVNNPGVNSVVLSIDYDTTRLKLESAQFGDEIAAGAFVNCNLPYITLVRNDDCAEDVLLVTMTFNVLPDAEDGKAYVTLKYDQGGITNYEEKDVEFTVVPGGITVSNYLPGDINGDGKVNSKDLTRLLKFISHENVEVNEAALDVNGDGKVNSKDLTRLLRYISRENVEIH